MKQPDAPKSIARGDAVYFVASECKTYVKIGRSNDAVKRLKTLQTSSPLKLILLGAVHAKPAYEKYLHACFAKKRLHGEWFLNDATLEKAIEVILGQPSFNFPELEYAPQMEGLSLESFFGTAFKNSQAQEEIDPLKEWYGSKEYRRIEKERDAMTGEQLGQLAKLEEAQAEIIRASGARGNDEVLHVCEVACFVLSEFPEIGKEQLVAHTLLVMRRAEVAMKEAAEIIEKQNIQGDEACARICHEVALDVAQRVN